MYEKKCSGSCLLFVTCIRNHMFRSSNDLSACSALSHVRDYIVAEYQNVFYCNLHEVLYNFKNIVFFVIVEIIISDKVYLNFYHFKRKFD